MGFAVRFLIITLASAAALMLPQSVLERHYKAAAISYFIFTGVVFLI